MMSSEWNDMGCGAYEDEFDCMANVVSAHVPPFSFVRSKNDGQNAQDAFTKHWDTWITQDDINQVSPGHYSFEMPF